MHAIQNQHCDRACNCLEDRELVGCPRAFAKTSCGRAMIVLALAWGGHDALADPSREAAESQLRRFAGQHIVLFTDLPATASLEELPRVVDQAVPQWAAYFGVPPAKAAKWRLTGYIMRDRAWFSQVGLLPADLPPFPEGYQRDDRFWLVEQPSEYYRRHLLLHEATHGFADWVRLGVGSPWFREGTAEFLATHRWHQQRLTLGFFPRQREEVPEWGRIKLIRDAIAAGRRRGAREVMLTDLKAYPSTEVYAWSWGLSMFLERHPRYREPLRQWRSEAFSDSTSKSHALIKGNLKGDSHAMDPLETRYDGAFRELEEEWRLFVDDLEYGYEIENHAIEFVASRPLPAGGAEAVVQANRGWQSTGYRLAAGERYRLTAKGRFQIAQSAADDSGSTGPTPWWSEPQGVTIRYHRGQPLGMLLAAMWDEKPQAEGADEPGWHAPQPIGAGALLVPTRSGSLYLLLNDSPAERSANRGEVQVRIEPD